MILKIVEEFAPQSRDERIAVLSPPRRVPRKARCDRCQVAYFWPAKRLRIEDARCPRCGWRVWEAAWYLAVPWYRCEVGVGPSVLEAESGT